MQPRFADGIVRSLGDRDFAYEVYLGFHEAYLNELSFLGTRDSNQRKRALN